MNEYKYSLELINFGIMTLADILKIINLQGSCFGVLQNYSGKHTVFFKNKDVADIITKIHDESLIDPPCEVAKKYICKS